MIRSSASAAASAAGSIRGVTDGLTMTPTPAADGCDVSVESNRGRTAEEMTAILQSFSESLLNVAGMIESISDEFQAADQAAASVMSKK